jgi:hypothetical protein
MPIVHNYLKARYADPAAAAQAVPQIAALIHEGQQAHAFWKSHRRMEQQGRRAEFWMLFRMSFMDVYTCLGPLAGGDCDEALLGFLEFGTPDKIELYADGNHVFLKASDLWCGADWEPLLDYLKVHCGAINAEWTGDEPSDYFALLDP